MTIPFGVRQMLDTIGQVAAEVPCEVEECREFVSVSKTRSSSVMNFKRRFPYFADSEWLYHVYRFRVRSELIDAQTNVSPDDLRDYQKLYIIDETILEQVLLMWLKTLDALGRPADCAIPI
jgi:hypothetical protein